MSTEDMVAEYLAKGGQIKRVCKSAKYVTGREMWAAMREGYKATGKSPKQRQQEELLKEMVAPTITALSRRLRKGLATY